MASLIRYNLEFKLSLIISIWKISISVQANSDQSKYKFGTIYVCPLVLSPRGDKQELKFLSVTEFDLKIVLFQYIL